MKFKILQFFIIIWFLKGFIIEYLLGMSPTTQLSSDPIFIKILLEGIIIVLFIFVFDKIKWTKQAMYISLPIFVYFLWAMISAYQNNLSILHAIKYSRYFIYSLFIYFIVKTIKINDVRIKKIILLFYYLVLLQIIISIFNILFHGVLENRIGTLLLMSGELGTIFPLIFLGFFIAYYHIVEKDIKYLFTGWLLLIFAYSTGKIAALIIFPLLYLFYEYYISNLLGLNISKRVRIIGRVLIISLIVSPFLVLYVQNIYFGNVTTSKNTSGFSQITKIIDFANKYTTGETSGMVRGRMAANTMLLNSISKNKKYIFGYGPMALYGEDEKGYGSGFTPVGILYGIVGWARDYLSLGFPAVIFMFWLIAIVFRRFRKMLKLRKFVPDNVYFIIMGSYLTIFVFVFDYLFYSAVTFVSGFPIFILMFGLGISENYIYNSVYYRKNMLTNSNSKVSIFENE